MLYLEPGMVRMDKLQKPVMHFHSSGERASGALEGESELKTVWQALLGVPAETKKGGASSEISSNGVWSLRDPALPRRKSARKRVQDMVDRAVQFIEAWNKARAR